MLDPPATRLAEQLAPMALFLGLPPTALEEIAVAGRLQSLGRGQRLFPQGAAAERCHAVLYGRVRIAQSGAEGGDLVLRFVGPSEMFGTVALFTDRRYPAEAVAMVDSRIISWTEPVLLELIHRHPQIALNLVRIVGERLREVQARLRELATERVDRRIARALLRLAGREDASGDGAASANIDFPLTRRDLAHLCGATLYTASRVLTAWEKAGYLATERRRLRILDLDALRRLAAGS